jgi:formamidopyrimidine-DNA glycosylase
MPELPEVHTTTTMLHKKICGKVINDVLSDYKSPHYAGKENIKDVSYFKKFKKEILNQKIIKVSRRGKNIVVEIESGPQIVIHMKMTGHLEVYFT